MIQIYRVPEEIPNFLPYGMALRALGQGLSVLMVTGDTETSFLVGDVLKKAFPTGFYHISHDGTPVELPVNYPDILILNDTSGAGNSTGYIMELVQGIYEGRIENTELVIADSQIEEDQIEKADLFTDVKYSKTKDDTNPNLYARIITGNGKGKTTYALGEALYQAAKGIPSLVLQFIKSPKEYGEVKASKKIQGLEIMSMGRGFPPEETNDLSKIHMEAAQKAWQFFLGVLNRPRYGFIVLDEINIALKYGFLNIVDVREMLLGQSQPGNLVLTGRYADPQLFPFVDVILEMKELKHPYQRGIKARRGIEY